MQFAKFISTVNVSCEGETLVRSSILERLAISALEHRGVPFDDAGKVSRVLVETSLRGIDTHGIRLLPIYANLLDGGKAKARPQIQLRRVGGSIAHLSANRALGPVSAVDSTREAIALAKTSGIGAVAVSGANHFGSAGHYALMMAESDCIGLVFSNADALVAPYAGRQAFFGTNPIAVAAPGEGDTMFCLDMATSQVAFSKVVLHKESGMPLGAGWALDTQGAATRHAADSSALLPLGGYKGQGLAMAIEILCTLLSGADFDHVLAHAFDGAPHTQQSIGHLFICISIAPFVDVQLFRRRLRSLVAALLQQEQRGDEAVFFAGQKESICRKERTVRGVPVSNSLLAKMHDLARPILKEEPDYAAGMTHSL